MAYQIGFDLYESGTQQFLQRVQAALRAVAPIPLPHNDPVTPAPAKESAMETDTEVKTETQQLEELSEKDRALQDRVTKLHAILGGDTTISMHLQFLIRTNKTDLLILKNTKVRIKWKKIMNE